MARRTLAALLALGATLLGRPLEARAAGECVQAYEATQVARKAGHLIDARRAALTCGGSSCPKRMAAECTAWGTELDRITPTVVFSFQRPDGSDAVGAQVTVDGRVVPLDGRPLPLDPGPHAVRVELEGFDPLEVQALVQESEQRRRVAGTLVAHVVPSAPPPAPSRAPFIAMLSVGAAATALGVGFGAAALVEYKHLESTCSPRCSPDDASTVRTRALVTDVSLAVAVASFATAIGLYFRPVSSSSGATVAILPVVPEAHGAGLGLRGSF